MAEEHRQTVPLLVGGAAREFEGPGDGVGAEAFFRPVGLLLVAAPFTTTQWLYPCVSPNIGTAAGVLGLVLCVAVVVWQLRFTDENEYFRQRVDQANALAEQGDFKGAVGVLEEIVHPAIRGMAAEGSPYTGVLYVGLMIDPSGAPRVIEFNVRFGDPETQALVVRMDGDLVPLLDGAARGRLDPATSPEFEGAAVCVVLASGGYPRAFETGRAISGLDAAEREPGVVVFHSGTRRAANGPAGAFETAGGRVLGVTARGVTVADARARAYAAAGRICFDGVHLRRDIAVRGLGAR